MLFNMNAMPTPRAAKATTRPNITPIASPPASASFIAEKAIMPKPAAIIRTAAPSIMNAFADASICFEDTLDFLPTVSTPLAVCISLLPRPLIPPDASFEI